MLRTTCRNLLTCFFVCFILLQQGCRTSPQNMLVAEWYFTDETFDAISSPSEDKILRLYPKGTYTWFGSFSYSIGKWRFNDKAGYIYLQEDSGTLGERDTYLKVTALQRKHLAATLHFGTLGSLEGGSRLCHLRSQQNKSTADPYSPEANSWRQPPTHPETDAALRQRVVNYLQFLKAMYRHAIDNEIEFIENGWYPAPIQMHYANGVRMAYSNELDDWNRCFYDSAEAVKGYQYISGQMYKLHIKPGVNRFERNLDCVNQLLRGIQ